MKALPFFSWAVFAFACDVRADDPAPSRSKLEIAPADILDTKEHDLGDRKIIVQKVVPQELPTVPEPAQRRAPDPEAAEAWRQRMQQQAKPREWVSMSITVIHDGDAPVRTRFQWSSKDRTRQFEAFSNVDGNFLTGIGRFQGVKKTYELLALVGNQDNVRLAARFSRAGKPFTPPAIPVIPQGLPAFVITKGEPAPEELAALQAIHDHYRTHGEAMRLAHEERQRQQQERAGFLAANPPQPKDIRLRFWKVPKETPSAPSSVSEGGGQ